jgi:hypothetical protein
MTIKAREFYEGDDKLILYLEKGSSHEPLAAFPSSAIDVYSK